MIRLLLLLLPVTVRTHGAMVFPAPRSAHNQTLDEHNRCGAAEPYSKTGSSTGLGDGEYCGIGCLGEACLYYQIGCYAGCGAHSDPFSLGLRTECAMAERNR